MRQEAPMSNLPCQAPVVHLTRQNAITGRFQQTCSFDEAAFDGIGVEEAASYWAGMMIADGTVSKKENGQAHLALALAARDEEQIEDFRKFLKASHKITRYSREAILPNGKTVM